MVVKNGHQKSPKTVKVRQLDVHLKRTELKVISKRIGVNFINLFIRNFSACRSQKRKKLLELPVFFVLLGSARIKAARKMFVKLAPGVCCLKLVLSTGLTLHIRCMF